MAATSAHGHESSGTAESGACPRAHFAPGLAVSLLFVLTGCASSNPGDLSLPQNRVLRDVLGATDSLRRDEPASARTQLDNALPAMGGIIANDSDARRARSLFFGEESRKFFIGEPYERVMAYYYRGILYWQDGEPDNARACFRSAQFQDADVEKHEYASDYVLLDYLDGLLTTRLGGDGADSLARARANARGSSPPDYPPAANVFCFIEFGRGPRKIAAGEYGEQLKFIDGRSMTRSAVVRVGQQQFPLVPYDDLYWQATTRGGRVMDHILQGKAVFRSTTDTLGNLAIGAGVGLAIADEGKAGAIVAGAGLLAKLIAASVTPNADTRAWDTLPQYLTFAALQLPAGDHSVGVDFKDAGGAIRESREARFTVTESTRDVVLFFSYPQ